MSNDLLREEAAIVWPTLLPAVDRLPRYMEESILGYVLHGAPVGGFLAAVFANDLVGACMRADDVNLLRIVDYAHLLCGGMPVAAWGSAEQRDAWIDRGGLCGR